MIYFNGKSLNVRTNDGANFSEDPIYFLWRSLELYQKTERMS